MMRHITLAAVVGLLLIVAASGTLESATRGVPRGAFLRKPVSSVEELAQQCVRDPVVAKRFAQHFGVKPDELRNYIEDNVVITKVTANTPGGVYVVTRSGKVVQQRIMLRRGQPIFALKDTGEPLLVLACGNPVLKELPARVEITSKTLPSVQVLRPDEAALPSALAALPPLVEAPTAEIAQIAPLAPAVAAPVAVSPVGPGRARFPWFIPPLIIGGGGNGDGGPPPPVIPEPGGAAAVMATVFIPAVGYGIRKLRAKRI